MNSPCFWCRPFVSVSAPLILVRKSLFARCEDRRRCWIGLVSWIGFCRTAVSPRVVVLPAGTEATRVCVDELHFPAMAMRAEACKLHPKLRHCQTIKPLLLRDVRSLGGPLVLQAVRFVNNLGDQTCNEESHTRGGRGACRG